MEIEVPVSSNESLAMEVGEMKVKVVEGKDQVRVKRKTLQAMLEQCQSALLLISNSEDGIDDDDDEDDDDKDDVDRQGEVSGVGLRRDQEVDEVCLILFVYCLLLVLLGFDSGFGFLYRC